MKLSFLEVASKIQTIPEHPNFKDKSGWRCHSLQVLFFTGMTQVGSKNSHPVATYACRCDCGNYTIVSTANLRPNFSKGIVSCGCIRESKHKHISDETVVYRVSRLESETPYKVIDCKNGGYDTKWTLLCEKHGSFKSSWGNVVEKKTQCPSCACLNRGFNQMIPGTFYLNKVLDNNDNLVAIKFGITNSTVEKRLAWLEYGTSYKLHNIFSFKFVRGEDAFNLESRFAKKFGKKFLTKEELNIGYTETVSPDSLNEYLEWVNKQINVNKCAP